MKQEAVPSRDELDDAWFTEPATWKPPKRQSSRPPSIPAAPSVPAFDEDEVDRWFV